MFSSGLVVGKFAPLHAGHQLLIETALVECTHLTVLVYANPDFAEMPQSVRADWVRRLYPAARVLEPKGAPPDSASDDVSRNFVRRYLEDQAVSVDAVFTSEAYGDGFAKVLGVPHRLVDLERRKAPISGTALRADIYGHRQMLSPIVYRHFVRTVVFLGAESTGKSTLAAHMADKLGTSYVHEVGRDYYAERSGKLELADYVQIARLHQKLEGEKLMSARGILLIDTNALTTLFYSYYYTGAALRELHEIADLCPPRYDLSLVCDTDIPFEQDGWRDTAALREKSQHAVLMDLNSRRIAYRTISGSLEARTRATMAAIESLEAERH